jgi:hypothetical protein
MHCPECKKRAISFVSWGVGNRWMSYRCPHCGVLLRVSRRTILTASISFVVAVVFLVLFSDRIHNYFGIKNQGRYDITDFICILAVLVPVSYWDWRTGSYALRGSEQPKKQS